MEKIILEINEQEARILVHACKVMSGRKNGNSRRVHMAKKLAALRKEYSESKSLDAVLLAANGGHFDMLSGRSGELRRAVTKFQNYMKWQEEEGVILQDLRQRIKDLLPEIVEQSTDCEQ